MSNLLQLYNAAKFESAEETLFFQEFGSTSKYRTGSAVLIEKTEVFLLVSIPSCMRMKGIHFVIKPLFQITKFLGNHYFPFSFCFSFLIFADFFKGNINKTILGEIKEETTLEMWGWGIVKRENNAALDHFQLMHSSQRKL